MHTVPPCVSSARWPCRHVGRPGHDLTFLNWVVCPFDSSNRRFSSHIDTLCHSRDGMFGTATPVTRPRVAHNSFLPHGLKKPGRLLKRTRQQGLFTAWKLHATFVAAAESNRPRTSKGRQRKR